MIIGTAGHIDHGKTSLVRALTGVDTDRLPEEKQRGITIELGYAYLPSTSGGVLGFIDVPGHEKFVHTMLAGATGIDFGLIVVAADDGVMPQTREHIDILGLLGVENGAVAITKIDRADTARIAAVAQDMRELLSATPLADAPAFSVSSVTGAGIDSLREHLFAARAGHHRAAGAERFRLAIDRVFTLEGHGTVVTGTVFSGRIRTGDPVALTPQLTAGQYDAIRLRSIHAQNRRTELGQVGERCALNLAGIGKGEIERGQWITSMDAGLETARIDVSIHVLPGEKAVLRSGTQVHVHLGAAHTLGRLVSLEGDSISPGTSVRAQLVLSRALGAWHGDRFILRDASAQRTVAGGRVIDPFAPTRYRKTRERLDALAAHALADPAASLDALTRISAWGVDLSRYARARCLSLDTVRGLPTSCQRIVAGETEYAFDGARLAELRLELLRVLDTHHSAHPELAGCDANRLKRIAMPKLPDAAMHALVAALIQAGECVQSGIWLARPHHAEKLNQQDKMIAEHALPLITEGRFDPPWVRDIARTIGQPETLTRGALARLAKQGRVFAIVKDLYYGATAVDELSRIALRLEEGDRAVRAAEFRDATGLGRKRAIQILEFFDQIGFTRRQGDDHKIRNRTLFTSQSQELSPQAIRQPSN